MKYCPGCMQHILRNSEMPCTYYDNLSRIGLIELAKSLRISKKHLNKTLKFYGK